MTPTGQTTAPETTVQDAEALASAVAERLPVGAPGTCATAAWGEVVAELSPATFLTARFTSAWTGLVVVALPESTLQGLVEPGESSDPAAAVAAALSQGLETGGPAVVEPATVAEAQDAAALLTGEHAVVALRSADGAALAVVGVALETLRRTVPAQGGAPRATVGDPALNLLGAVEMDVTVELGRARMPIRDLLSLAPGSLVGLDRAAGSPADILVNGRLIARGEVVVVDEDYAIRVTEIVPGAEPTA